ncbi:glycosyl transferase family 1 [Flavobacterium noncentrifugens]|uniref:Glycosyl transferases group 1 n=1 Tax=Flavobacterium noncentrifugens TaxID=1128970 RepID=A0A1G9BQE1_9FLAO|nr:glycosyltransferase [Flavobacterium noncentrifugens]GEP52317.1 glycosyl transferase family 1 [Flavobacterium noncentrifugens]SDK41125.1 Glycosyl transferases group 1 [Flavobacterium noncentrifugens]
MKILLIGEYSRLHNSLKEGLMALGHEVKIVGTGDAFKDFPVDFSIAPKFSGSNGLSRFLNKIFFRLFKTDLEDLEKGWYFSKLLPILKGYDVVQLINSNAIETLPLWQIKMYRKLFDQNGKKFLLVCGEEHPIIEELLKNKMKYSILSPYFENPKLKNGYTYTLKYTTALYKKLYDFVASEVNGIITSDLDYKIPMDLQHIKNTFIPNPINTDKIAFVQNPVSDKIFIFHGVNRLSSIKKGNAYFEEALKIIKEKYPEKVEILQVESVPYDDYIKLYNKAHILLDQVFGYDQGYNALEAMASGKVVFTGAESEFTAHYDLNKTVNVNAVPDALKIAQDLSYLIENPLEITEIGERAREFIIKEHEYKMIAGRYLDVWSK